MRDDESATLEFMFSSMQLFSTLPTHFLLDYKQCVLQQTSAAAVVKDLVYLQNSVGV